MRLGGAYPKRIRENPCSCQYKRQYEDIVNSKWKTINNRLERLYTEIGVTSKAEKKQQKEEAGFVSELFPKVVKIGISMTYAQTGVLEPLTRAINFSPNSHAIFKVNCLCSDCIEGGFDFTKIISSMVRAGKTTFKGEINCDDCSAPECSDAAYSITIKYALTK